MSNQSFILDAKGSVEGETLRHDRKLKRRFKDGKSKCTSNTVMNKLERTFKTIPKDKIC